MSRAPIAIALDAPDLETLRSWVSQTCEYVTTMKVGLEVFCRDGHAAVAAVREAATSPVDIFLDLKLHDIPATVAGAARAVASVQPRFLTVHASGGPAMIAAAADAPAHAPDATDATNEAPLVGAPVARARGRRGGDAGDSLMSFVTVALFALLVVLGVRKALGYWPRY